MNKLATIIFTTVGLAGLWLTTAQAVNHWQVTIQPIRICDDAGANCANSEGQLWEAEGDKIWAQAGIDMNFLPWTTLPESDFLILSGMEFRNILSADPAAYGGSADPTVINIWFADNFGFGYAAAECTGCRNIAVSWIIVQGFGDNGRMDTLAHEIGHTFGMDHNAYFSGEKNLMAAGELRLIPQTIDDIFPDGAQTSQLDPLQIIIARASPYVMLADTDGDGVTDDVDNCIESVNPGQTDFNGDLIGDACDPDVTGPLGGVEDCIVNFLDLQRVKQAFFATPASPTWDGEVDFDNSQSINFADLQVVEQRFFGPPGPSAAGCF